MDKIKKRGGSEGMKIKEATSAELLRMLEDACFEYAHKQTKTAAMNLLKIEREMARRLGISEEEIIRD